MMTRRSHSLRLLLLVVLIGAITGCASTRVADAPLQGEAAAPGVRYWMVTRKEPRTLRIHHLQVDLADPRIELAAALAEDPDGDGPATAKLTPPLELARKARALVLVNANPWQALPDAAGKRSINWHEGMAVQMLGLAESGGAVRSSAGDPAYCSVWIDAKGKPHIGRPATEDGVREGVAGFLRLLENGRALDPPNALIHPRTALGIDATGRYLCLVIVDGRQPGFSEGMSLKELAAYMRELGCTEAVNLDGGGSSIMLLAEGDGQYRVLNDPSTKVAGKSVARPIPVALAVRLRAGQPVTP